MKAPSGCRVPPRGSFTSPPLRLSNGALPTRKATDAEQVGVSGTPNQGLLQGLDLPVGATHGFVPIHKHELLSQGPLEFHGRAGEELGAPNRADAEVLQTQKTGVSRGRADKRLTVGDLRLKDISFDFAPRAGVSNLDGQRVELGADVACPIKVCHARLTYSAQYLLAANRRGHQTDY